MVLLGGGRMATDDSAEIRDQSLMHQIIQLTKAVIGYAPEVSQGTKRYLARVAWSTDVIEKIDKKIRLSRKSFHSKIWISLIVGALLFALAAYFSSQSGSFPHWAVVFYILYLLSLVAVMLVFRLNATPRAFLAFIFCIDTLNRILHSDDHPPAFKERQILAGMVLHAAHNMRSYRPLLPLRLHKRIVSRSAIKASQVMRRLTYPAILGDDNDLKDMREMLARAAIRIGTGNWTQVSDLDWDVSRYSAVKPYKKWFAAIPTALTVLISIIGPIIPILIKAAK